MKAVSHAATTARWRPGNTLVAAILAFALVAVAFVAALAALRGPINLGYGVTGLPLAHHWRVTWVSPGSFASDAGLRQGTVLVAAHRPPMIGRTTLAIAIAGRCCRVVAVPLNFDTMMSFVPVELAVALVMGVIGVVTILFALARRPAWVLLLLCVAMALCLCGVAASTVGTTWGTVLFNAGFLGVLPPLVLLLAMYVPTGGRAAPFGLAYPVAVGAVLFLATAVEQSLIYSASTPFVEDMLFEAALLLAVCLLCAAGGLWLWRGLSARGTASWTDYRAVLIGLGGGFGLFFLLTFISTAVHVPLPWPPEWGGLALLLVPGSLAWVLVRRQVFRLRQALYRPAVSAALIAALLLMALLLSPTLQSAGLGVALVLLAALGVPAAQRELELQRGRARE